MLKDKVVVVTGGSGFLGQAIVNKCLSNTAIAKIVDINDLWPDSENIDVLVNCIRQRTNGFCVHPEQFDKDIHNELTCVYEYCLKAISKFHPMSIVNIASIQGMLGNNANLYNDTDVTSPISYNVAKAGIIAMTKYLAGRLGNIGIRVNCVSPGGIYNNEPIEFVKKYSHLCPMNRMGIAEEVANAVLFLASDMSSYITGHNLVVDGGYSII